MGSFSHLGDSGLSVTVVAIASHCLYLLLRDLLWSQTSFISQWPQGNSITNNCWKVCPMISIKWNLCYCLPRFLFGLFSAFLPVWFIPCFSSQLLLSRMVHLIFFISFPGILHYFSLLCLSSCMPTQFLCSSFIFTCVFWPFLSPLAFPSLCHCFFPFLGEEGM